MHPGLRLEYNELGSLADCWYTPLTCLSEDQGTAGEISVLAGKTTQLMTRLLFCILLCSDWDTYSRVFHGVKNAILLNYAQKLVANCTGDYREI